MSKITSLSHLEKVTNGNTDTLKELLSVFVTEGSRQIQKLELFLDKGDLEEVKNTAHKVKSSLLLIGLDAYKPLAERIENSSGKDTEKTKTEVRKLITVYKQALDELNASLKKLA